MAHQIVLWRDQITELKAANEVANRQKQRKRKRIQQGEVLTFKASSHSKKSRGNARADRVELTQRRCRNCGGTEHNAQTCQINKESTIESSNDEELEVDYSGVE
ncbi:hypothetical protein K469DRAFT_697357 [Zopfia rhizophila CBS 207.26]|uniref:CCHC-type domain-containing protein n=1 Tax=Zopfia rhizophila CBS 207.26 TaxID=1314779 RepID=A0A6A6DCW3_9PEZI|nr:hypothetical protein K469DRAFT_697357 [Zopfia rhizophila CBS 207.26]